jgi:glucosylceramidase
LQVFKNVDAEKYVSGVAVHWYMDALAPAFALDDVHKKFPSKFLLATEACEGADPWQEKVVLGSWDRAESYAHDIIEVRL